MVKIEWRTRLQRKDLVVASEGVNYSKIGDINYWNEILPEDEALAFIEQEIKIEDIAYLKEDELEKIIEHFDLKEKLKVRKIREDLISKKKNNVSKPRGKSGLPTVTFRHSKIETPLFSMPKISKDKEENNHDDNNNNNNNFVAGRTTTCILS